MTTRRFTNISVLFISLIAVLFFVLSAHSATSNPAVISRSEVADLAQTIEELTNEVKLLQKKIQVLSDFLDDLTNILAASAQTEKATPAQASTSKLRSPRQIDRAPVREEKTNVLLARLQVSEIEEDMIEPLTKLLSTKNKSNFVQSLRSRLIEWLETPTGDRSFASPFSPKQFAWIQYILYPGDYPNPKTNKDLYPNG